MRIPAMLIGILAATSFACAHRNDVPQGQPAPDAAVTVSVENNNWQDVDVYAVRSGQRYRLGSVTTANTASFTLPRELVDAPDLRFQIHPIGGAQDFLSGRVIANPGDVIQLKVGNAITHTSVLVR